MELDREGTETLFAHKTDIAQVAIFGWLLSAIVYLVGGIDHLFIACTIFVVLDYATGVIAAWYKKELSSRKGWWGLLRKSLTFVFVIVAHQLDLVAGNESNFMRNAMLLFVIGTEGISIFENLGKLGLRAPKFILESLKNMSNEGNKKNK